MPSVNEAAGVNPFEQIMACPSSLEHEIDTDTDSCVLLEAVLTD
jgi:hypothetical protein